jgi:hypothetical protein
MIGIHPTGSIQCSRVSEEQIIGTLKAHEAGISVADLRHKPQRFDHLTAATLQPRWRPAMVDRIALKMETRHG